MCLRNKTVDDAAIFKEVFEKARREAEQEFRGGSCKCSIAGCMRSHPIILMFIILLLFLAMVLILRNVFMGSPCLDILIHIVGVLAQIAIFSVLLLGRRDEISATYRWKTIAKKIEATYKARSDEKSLLSSARQSVHFLEVRFKFVLQLFSSFTLYFSLEKIFFDKNSSATCLLQWLDQIPNIGEKAIFGIIFVSLIVIYVYFEYPLGWRKQVLFYLENGVSFRFATKFV